MREIRSVLSGYDREPVAAAEKSPEMLPPKSLPDFSVDIDTRISPFPLTTAIAMAISEGLDELQIKAGITIIRTGNHSYCVKVEKTE